MSEALHEAHDYFDEQGPLLDRLSKRFFEVIAECDPHTAAEFDFFDNSSHLLRDGKLHSPQYIEGRMERLLRITNEKPSGGFYVATTRVHPDYRLELECASIFKPNHDISASHLLIVKTDDQLIERLALTTKEDTHIAIHHRLVSREDDLIDLIAQAAPTQTIRNRLTDLIESDTDKEMIEATLTEILAEHQEDPLEQQFMEHLFVLIRTRMRKEREGQAAAAQLGADKPSSTELEHLLNAMAT
jgi:hypothetical protein